MEINEGTGNCADIHPDAQNVENDKGWCRYNGDCYDIMPAMHNNTKSKFSHTTNSQIWRNTGINILRNCKITKSNSDDVN